MKTITHPTEIWVETPKGSYPELCTEAVTLGFIDDLEDEP